MPRYIDLGMVEYLIDHFGGMVTWNKKEVLGGIKKHVQIHATVDVAEVVRCKDCKHYRNHPNGLCDCWTEPYANERGYKGDMHCVEPDDFCSYGERKE